eukprot:jgi/Mesen1/7311/ME000376S06476
MTGPALPISFLIAGAAAGLAALCYAELASRCPSAGSAYHYAYITVEELVAWLIGWALILEYSVGGSAVARGISPNLAIIFGGNENLPAVLARVAVPDTSIILDPCAAFMVTIITALLSAGIRETASFQAVVTLGNVLVLVFVIVAGSWAGCKSGWQGYRQASGYIPYGVNGVLGGAAMVFYSYIGFDTVKRPQKDLPLGIGLSLVACGSLYMGVALVLVGLVPYTDIDLYTPMSSAFAAHGMPWAIVSIVARKSDSPHTGGHGASAVFRWQSVHLIQLTSECCWVGCPCLLCSCSRAQPRILMAMSRDGLLPAWFNRLNSTSGVPVNSTVFTGVLAACMALVMDIDQLSGMVSFGTLLAFTVVSISVLVLRYVPPVTPQPKLSPPSSPNSIEEGSHKLFNKHYAESPAFITEGSEPLPIAHHLAHTSPLVSVSSNDTLPSFPSYSPRDELRTPLLIEQEEEAGDSLVKVESCQSLLEAQPILRREQLPVATESGVNAAALPLFSCTDQRRRRRVAALAIASFASGVPLLAIAATSSSLPRWVGVLLACLATPLVAAGGTTLFAIKEDEGRHHFGHSEGFHCPCVPGLPLASILINVYLLINLGYVPLSLTSMYVR